ncbi:pro-Pol polyprotein [Trichonephila clavipes]|nr:pro-Pol polyprotein [Trichonephila clavipes]
MKIFCQTGFPKTICTDQGTNFTAQLTQAFQDVLGVSPRFSTPGHPENKETQPNIGIELNQMPDILNSQQKPQLRKLLQQYEDIFRNRPGKANVKGHSVKVMADSSSKRLQPYRVPIPLQKEVERQVNELLNMDLIEQ